MFTGIIEAMARVARRGREGDRTVLTLSCPEWRSRLAPGDSVAVDGVCLTVTRLAGDRFTMDLGSETLKCTTLGAWKPGRRVNLERPVKVGDPLGGHIVQGHVDGVVRVIRVEPAREGKALFIEMPQAFEPYLIEKGSVAINGVSLTVTGLGRGEFGVFLIPFTLKETNLDGLRAGDNVNLELDPMGKYVARWLAETGRIPAGSDRSGPAPRAGRNAPTAGSHES